jgi:DNA damage-binding protein 1
MAYVTPIHHPSSVKTATKLCLRHEDEECLAVARYNRLELYTLSQATGSDGVQVDLELVSSTRIYGRITVLQKFRPAESSTDHIFIGTDSSPFFTMEWDHENNRLKTARTFEDHADQTLKEAQTGERCHVDPTGRFLTLEVYEGVITTIPLHKKDKKKVEKGVILDPVISRIPELFVKSSAFSPGRGESEPPRLALIHGDHDDVPRLRIRQLDFTAGDPSAVDFSEVAPDSPPARQSAVKVVNEPLEYGSSHIIPLQESPWGLLILGETSITYYNDATYETLNVHPLKEATIWTAWDRIDNTRYVLADEYSQLWLLMYEFDGRGEGSYRLDKLGQTSRATSIVYMGEGLVFIGAHAGDSQVVRIVPGGLDFVQSIPNIAPIFDFTVMDMGNRSSKGPSNDFSTGQARIVACCGYWENGSIRSIRSGVGLIEHAIIPDLAYATQLFSLPTTHNSNLHSLLLVGFVDETRLFLFDQSGNVEERSEFHGLELDCPTLFAGAIRNGEVLQVTPKSVRIVDIESGFESSVWTSTDGVITTVSVTDDLVALVVNGTQVIVLNTSSNLRVQSSASCGGKQVSCLAISVLLPGICLVGFWHNSEVAVLDLESMEQVHAITLTEDGVGPRSILASKLFEKRNPTVLFSMADGHVISFELDPHTCQTTQRTTTILGTKQPDLQQLPRADGTSGVFVASETPSLIYADDGKLSFSAVDTQDTVNCVCSFNSEAFPNGIVLATPTDVRICLLEETRTTHVQPLHIGESARRLAYSPALKAFGLGTIRRWIDKDAECVESKFKLVDEVMFKELASATLRQDELVEAVIRTEIKDRYGQKAERFIIGTSVLDDDVVEKFKGRIIVYEVTEDRQLKVVASHAVKTPCQCLAMVGEDIVAALHKTIVIFSFVNTEGSSGHFKKQATQTISTIPVSISVEGNEIAVADLIKSVTILEYKRNDPAYPGPVLIETARHYETFWATALTQVQQDTWIEADAEGNLIALYREREGVTDDDKRRLRVIGEFRLGEQINRMCKIDVGKPNMTVEPKAFMATVRLASMI